MNNPNASDTFATTVSGYQTRFRALMSGGDTGGDPGGGGRYVDVPGSTWTQAQHDQMAVVEKAKSDLAAGLASDPVSTTAALAHLEVPQLDSAAGFDAYKKLYDKLDAIHHFTPEQQRPLTQPAVTVLSNLLNSNDPNKMLQVWAGLARWSPQMQEAAYKQLHETAPFGATAGRFYASNKVGLANAMILGHNSLELNKGVKAAWQDSADTWFQDNMADITRLGFNQTSAAGLKEAVDALYAGRHGTGKPLNEAEYQRANEDVYGGKFDTVNGGNVIVPDGTTGPKMELAQQVWDWTAISVTHTPPMGEDPITHELQVIGPKGLALAVPTRVTEGVYAFMDPDGGLFHTMVEGPNGSKEGAVYKAYVTAETVNAAAAQAQDVIANSPEGADVSPFPPAPAGGGPGGAPGQVFGYPADFYAKNPDAPNPKSTAASGFTSMDRSIEASGQGPAPLLTGSAAIGVGRNTTAESRGGVPPITPTSDREMQDMADHYIETLKNSGSKISDESLKVFREEFLNHLRAQQMQ